MFRIGQQKLTCMPINKPVKFEKQFKNCCYLNENDNFHKKHSLNEKVKIKPCVEKKCDLNIPLL